MSLVLFTPEVEADILQATTDYERKSEGLGRRFVSVVESRIALLAVYLRMAVELPPGVRRLLLKPFPYGVFYRLYRDDEVVGVFAVLHLEQNPRTLSERFR